MKITCPHCSQPLELAPDVLAALQGQPHFACPICQGLMAVPDAEPPPPRPGPRRPQDSGKINPVAVQSNRGLNRNVLVLGTLVLITLGGLAAFLASRNDGNVLNIFRNFTNQIIHNSYFSQLIASGVTTEKDLNTIAEIKSYGGGFIGISKQALDWEQAQALAKRTGAEILSIEDSVAGTGLQLTEWLRTTLAEHLSAPAWVLESGQARILDGAEMLSVTGTDRPRKVLVHWRNASANEAGGAAAIANPWHDFDPGRLVFEDALMRPDSLNKWFLFYGQYSSHFSRASGCVSVTPGVGMMSVKAHTRPMAWAPTVLGDRCRLEFEVRLEARGSASFVLKGSGTGNSLDTGYGVAFDNGRLGIHREGAAWMAKTLPTSLNVDHWHTIQADINGPHLALRLDGTLVASGSVNEPLNGPLHGWVGFSGNGVWYRNLRIYSSETDQKTERQFLPPATTAPRPNGEQIYAFSEPGGPLGARWQVVEPHRVAVKDRALILTGRSLAMLDLPISGSFAVEVKHEFDHREALNFHIKLAYAATLPRRLPECNGCWQLALPDGSGGYQIRWAPPGYSEPNSGTNGEAKDYTDDRFLAHASTMVASTPYFMPIPSRQQTFRCEVAADTLRVFLDGRLLMNAVRPAGLLTEAPVFLGLGQFYSLSKISSIRIYKIQEKP